MKVDVTAFGGMKINLHNNNNKLEKKMVRCTINNSIMDGDWLIFEILTRLPVKSLFRFKSACKKWCCLIEKDQNFIDSHLTLSKTRPPCRLFIVIPAPMTEEEIKRERELDEVFSGGPNWPFKEFHITADLFEDNGSAKVVFDTVREIDSSSYEDISSPVNGLVCLIDSLTLYAVRICNISSGELSPWFNSPSLSEKDHRGLLCHYVQSCNFAFGFDPDTNEHKLVFLWEILLPNFGGDYIICEVLTIGRQGGNRWTRINEVPPNGLTDTSVYVNGVIYWCSFQLEEGSWDTSYGPLWLVAFDVRREKFRKVTVPNFILEQPRDHPEYYQNVDENFFIGHVSLLQVDGRLAVIFRMNYSLFKMYIYDDDKINRTPTGSSSSSSFPCSEEGSWSEVCSITLPFNMGKDQSVKFYNFVGSDDKVILKSKEGPECRVKVGGKKCVYFYCYNWKKSIWTELERKADVLAINTVDEMYSAYNYFHPHIAESLARLVRKEPLPKKTKRKPSKKA